MFSLTNIVYCLECVDYLLVYHKSIKKQFDPSCLFFIHICSIDYITIKRSISVVLHKSTGRRQKFDNKSRAKKADKRGQLLYSLQFISTSS